MQFYDTFAAEVYERTKSAFPAEGIMLFLVVQSLDQRQSGIDRSWCFQSFRASIEDNLALID
jgi:hypothetical protein